MKPITLTVVTLLLFLTSIAQAPNTVTSGDIYLGLRKLNVLGSVLYVAAHPDDENTRLLTYLSKDKLYRTGYLSLTRGDGGQNLIGDEQGIELGLIRTQELLAARRVDGAEQFFTRAFDFGFSKNPEETFTKWPKEKILADVVWVIRQFQPDVIITRFPTTGEGGHGHHTASAILANEAFKAAADPNRFPEQLKWVQPWQAKRVLWNTFNFGGNNTIREDQFKVDVGGYNAVLGKSYGEIAAVSRSQHKSQGFGVASSRGEALEYFTTTAGTAPKGDLFDDVTTSWKRTAGGDKIEAQIERIIQAFDFTQPQASVPALVQLYKSLKSLSPSYWQQQKMKEVQALIEQCSGLWMEAYAAEAYIAQTDSLRIFFALNNRLGAKAQLKAVQVEGKDTTINAVLSPNKNLLFSKPFYVPEEKGISQPYWLQERKEEGYFIVSDQKLIGQPDVQPAYTVTYTVQIEGEDFVFEKPVRFKFTDPVKGEQYQPLAVVAPLNVYINPSLLLFKNDGKEEKTFSIQAIANKSIRFKKATVKGHTGRNELSTIDSSGAFNKGANWQYHFAINKEAVAYSNFIQPLIQLDTSSYINFLGLSTIRYDHIPYINYFYSDALKLLKVDLKTAGKKVGYITGAGDKVPEALEQMGYEVTLLGDKELGRNSLNQYDAIITGVRAYNTADWLNSHYDKLMQYVAAGGNLIVQYNTSSQIGPVRAKIGPYPFNISRTRVTNEAAPVTFTNPAHPVLNYPNKITTADFKDWVQERSIYHASGYDKNFETIISMNDEGEAPDAGSLITAKYGKGHFTYTGLVFFRQLPAGVPGAYRLLANLIALNQKKEL